MCDFKPGDEVVCVDDAGRDDYGHQPWVNPISKGQVYVVCAVGITPDPTSSEVVVFLSGVPNTWVLTGGDMGWRPTRFRKAQKCDIGLSIDAFLTIKPGFEEPRRKAPAKKERA